MTDFAGFPTENLTQFCRNLAKCERQLLHSYPCVHCTTGSRSEKKHDDSEINLQSCETIKTLAGLV